MAVTSSAVQGVGCTSSRAFMFSFMPSSRAALSLRFTWPDKYTSAVSHVPVSGSSKARGFSLACSSLIASCSLIPRSAAILGMSTRPDSPSVIAKASDAVAAVVAGSYLGITRLLIIGAGTDSSGLTLRPVFSACSAVTPA